jgi:hypothetical protein
VGGAAFERHLVSVEAGREPLTSTDARDLGVLLEVPSDGLRLDWSSPRGAETSDGALMLR